MAWRGKVTDTSPRYSDAVVEVAVQYFDDAQPATILYSEVIQFAAYASLAELQAKIKESGARERKKRSQVDAALAAIPVGVEVVI